MIARTVAFALTLVLCCAIPFANAFEHGIGQIFLFNLTSCGQYAQDRKLPKGLGAHGADAIYVAGWLSALNALVPGVNIAGDTKVDDTMLWLDRYCPDHAFYTMQDRLMVLGHQIAPKAPAGVPSKKTPP